MNPSNQPRTIVAEHDATRGVLSAIVIGAVMWTATIAALRWLLG